MALNEKISNFNFTGGDSERGQNGKKEQFEHKIRQLEEKLEKANQNDEAKLRLLEDQLIKTQDACLQYKQGNELMEERKHKEWKLIENDIQIELNRNK